MAMNSFRSPIGCASRARPRRRCSSRSTPTCSRRGRRVRRDGLHARSERASDAEAARIADAENAADKAAGVQESPGRAGVADILFDLERRETRAYAHIFSRGVVADAGKRAPLNSNPERSAGFVVLKAPDFPSVLVELGYLSNAKDVQAMKSPEWRLRTASAMAEAVDRFFASGRASAAPAAGADALAASERPGANPPGRPPPPDGLTKPRFWTRFILPPQSPVDRMRRRRRRPHVPDNGRALG